MFRLFSTILLLSLSVSGAAQALDPSQTAENVVSEWRNWMAKHGIRSGSIVVSFEGTEIAESGIKRTVDDPVEVASLSKAITSVCTLKALEEFGKDQTMTLAEAAPELLAKYPPTDSNLATVTVGKLIAQNSGIHSVYHRKQLPKLRTFGKENKAWQFSKLAKEKMAMKPSLAGYHYSNANYLVLGLVIEAVTGEDYETYCNRTVLVPAGASSAKLSEVWTVLSSYGGWKVSARDYLAFVDTYFGNNQIMGQNAATFTPSASAGRGVMYGPGVFYRTTAIGINVWHNGSWKWRGKVNDKFGAYFAAYDNGFTVVVNYDHDAWDGQQRELDGILYKVTHP